MLMFQFAVVGFMGTGACLLDKESDMPCGLIIEKVNGIPCEKRLASDDETFTDVRYLLEMCRQVRHTHQCIALQAHSFGPSHESLLKEPSFLG